jgi:methylphosphotriester-DNA--protein-cysteine methyltransferase
MRRYTKKYPIVLVTTVVLFAFIFTIAVAANYKYVGSAKSNKYHYPSCRWAQKIHSKDLVTFNSAEDALGAGYIPCKVCKPPVKDYANHRSKIKNYSAM